jgi:predicted RND superfamily exporter protein
MSDSENNNDSPKKVSKEFINKVRDWIKIDDSIREIRAKTKELTNEKKQHEEYILNYMEQIDEKCFNIKDGKLRRNVSKAKGPLKKTIIQQALVEITGDAVKAKSMTEHIINSRPTVERVNLKRTFNRGPKKK